jgi:hypothetical protein
MLTSVLSPTRLINPEPMPWNWNPAATFQTAYNDAQEEKRAQQTFDLGMQLEQILLPAKVAKADYEMKKLGYESKLLEKIYRTESAAMDNAYRGVTSAVGGGQGGGGGNNAPATNAQQPPTTTTDNYFTGITPQSSNEEEIIAP